MIRSTTSTFTLAATNRSTLLPNWEFLDKNLKDISNVLNNDINLSKLDLYILGLGYLEKRVSRFIKVIMEDNVQEIAKQSEIFDSKAEQKRQITLQKEK